MYITKKHLSRRTVLRGMGVSMTLPLLDAMVPARTLWAQTAQSVSYTHLTLPTNREV